LGVERSLWSSNTARASRSRSLRRTPTANSSIPPLEKWRPNTASTPTSGSDRSCDRSEPGIESLQEGLLGSEAGERETVDVPHEDLQLIYDRSKFESMVEESAEVGAEIHAKTGLLGEVVAVDEESVPVDFDPERAGQTLTFEVEVLEIE